MTTTQFIKKRPQLIWYVKDLDNLSDASILEHTLNYGDWDDVQKLLKIMGVKKAAKIFWEKANQPRCNYRPEIKNYFNPYFNKYAR